MTLPRDGDRIVTSADMGHHFAVQVEYNTDEHGTWVDERAEHPRTLHGPFTDESEAKAWVDDYPDDTDVWDMAILVMNKVRP